ncbi:hypothetical protein ACQP2F_33225 [Actinoplanes sp. CA-030573]|uniref:hypothetical protein n=1 Tax=Actinoplanes sp. CA-030573 TaxID=3239898 RepID=UPI003D8BA60E
MTGSETRALAGLDGDPFVDAQAQLRSGRCVAGHEQYLALLRKTPDRTALALPPVVAALALCERRRAVLDLLVQHTGALPAVGDRQRDRAITALIAAISDPRGRAEHRPSCEYRGQPDQLRWRQIRERIRQLEYSPHLPPHAWPADSQAPTRSG